MLASAQEKSVSGIVKDQFDTPVIGASVIIKGTSKGTVTDFDGNYTLTGVSSGDVLEFHYVGLKTKEVVVGDQTQINVIMDEDVVGIDEVVIVGFGTQKKVNLTGSVAVVDSEKLESRPVQNSTQMLQGLAPGLNISQNGGNLDDRSVINIRGIGAIGNNSNAAPLVLIDGMEGDLYALNPQDIESVSVLKDAAASSIYGSRAPFGVILITTKKGKDGKTQVSYNNNFRWNTPINVPDMMDSYTFALYYNDANINGGQAPFFTDERIQAILNYQNGLTNDEIVQNPSNPQYWADGYGYGQANNDWYDVIYKDHSFSQEHNVNISGGTSSIQYYASGNYLDQNGLMEFNTDTYNRYTTSANITAKLSDWAKVSVTNRFIREDFQRPSQLTDGLFQDLARQGWPMLPVYDPNGHLISSPSPALGLRDGGVDKTQNDWLYQQGQVILEPVKDWTITGSLNYRTRNEFRHWDVNQVYNHDVDGNEVLTNSWMQSLVHEQGFRENYLNTNITTDYLREVGEGHNFKVLFGYQSELNKTRFLSAERNGIIVSSLPTINTTDGTDSSGEAVPPEVAGDYYDWATQGVFGRLNYNYKEKYLVEGNLRYDGTSRWRSDKRWNWFPSVSIGWNVAKEGFFEPLSNTVGNLKFRGSYGELGNQNTNNVYPTYTTMPLGTANGSWLVNGSQPNTSSAPGIVSQSLFWENIETYNVGLDLSMFDNKLNLSFDYFNRYTKGLLGNPPSLPATLGTGVPAMNNTDLKTVGFELALSWRDQLKNGLSYSVDFLLSDAQTEVTRFYNPTGDLNQYVEGRKLGEIWGYETIDIARYAGQMEAHLASLPNGGQDALGAQWAQGDIMYADLNGDGRIDSGAFTEADHGDMKVIGNNTPRFPVSLDLNVAYKGFDFRAFFQGVMKQDYYVNSYYFWGAWDWGIWWSTGLTQHEDYYRADPNHPLGQNLDSYYPRPLFGDGKNHYAQTGYLQDASYVRLKNLQFGYSLPNEVIDLIGLQKVRFYISAENIYTWTKMTGIFDPETIGTKWTGNNYPLYRTISYGLTINF
ncbi:TonB-dependent receptor [Mangrovimonas sp. AS39]|uniref:SusC/RagA family TonB-linked outer membrane protein n=1 Tax=Mangrovimonas futianensis TaxID=2895523 RepID=UPI001E4344CB|nr:TonB-dependent receptor [Mangrovimonas futianensis]MCF1192319.1 TonB-dependent receptor [Mangrovimonas futianensis]MCF1195932.1 TonB-dependent receptor [Mangrovimonas futianensis]